MADRNRWCSPSVETYVSPWRTCCVSLVSESHTQQCRSHFFAEGQTVIKSDADWTAGPGRLLWWSKPARIKEDIVASDRTFENETRLH